MSTEQSSEPQTIAGFWRRPGAFFLDCLLLGAIGLLIALFVGQQLVDLGPWGRLLGFAVAIAYFGPLNSRLGGGQTLGKRLLKIKVVVRDGAPLSVPKAFLRFIPLGTPWFLNNAQLPESILFSFWLYVLSVAVFGIGLSVIYLYCFNRHTRQSLHDLVVGSYVVASESKGTVAAPAPWPLHLVVCGLLILASALTPYFTKGLAAIEPFASLMNVYRAVSAEPWVVHAKVTKGKTFTSTLGKGQSEITQLNITAYTKDSHIENIERARQLAKLALATDTSANSLDILQVTLVYGYDIGIASSWRSQNHAHSPQEWSAK